VRLVHVAVCRVVPKWSPQLEHLHGSLLRAVAELAELTAGLSDLLARFAGMEVGLLEGDRTKNGAC
jgi:hypothetical protein